MTVRNTTVIGKLLVAFISGVLIPPENFAQVIDDNDLSELGRIVNSVPVPNFYPNGTNATIAEALEAPSSRGFTFFAPNDAAFRSAGNQLKDLAADPAALFALLSNHVCATAQLHAYSHPMRF